MSGSSAYSATSYAIAAGLLSGLLYGGIFGGDAGSLILGYFAPLPLFAVGLACGAGAAVTAAAVGALVALLQGGTFGVGFFLIVTALPVVALVTRALQRLAVSGATPGGGDRLAPADVEGWYPVGRLLVLMSLVGCALLGVFWAGSLATEPGPTEMVKQFVGRMTDINEGPFRPAVDGADSSALEDSTPFRAIVGVFPGVVLASWMIMVIINGVIAQALVRRFGTPLRPSPAMSELRVPDWISGAFTAALAAAILAPTPFDFLFSNIAVVLAIPCFFSGLAVVHAFSKRFEGRLPVLVGFYALVLLTVWPVALLVAIGAADPWFDLRQRVRPPDSGQES